MAYCLSYLKALPNFRIIYPANCDRLREIVKIELTAKAGPLIILYPYGFETDYRFNTQLEPSNSEILILTTGNLASEYQDYRITNSINNVKISVVEQLSPLDKNDIITQIKNTGRVLVAEEAVKRGGLGESIASIIVEEGLDCEFASIALDNDFYPGGTSVELRNYGNISAAKVFSSLGF